MELYSKKDKTLEMENKRLDKSPLPAETKGLLHEFQEALFEAGTGQYRIGKVCGDIRRVCEQYPTTDLGSFTKSDIRRIVAQINQASKWSEHTKRDYKRSLKQFFNWYEDEDPRLESEDKAERDEARKFYQHLRKKVKCPKPKSKLTRSEMLSDEDVRLLLTKGCSNSLERALVSLIHERPMRIGEVLRMRIMDFELKSRHAMITIPDGKTGTRTVPVLKSVPYLQEWLKDHPNKENMNAPLWVSKHNGHHGKPLRYVGVRKLLLRCAERVGWVKLDEKGTIIEKKKRCNSHHFRHSRATLDASKYTEQIISSMGGWQVGSKQLKTYIHLGKDDVEKAFKEEEGLVEKEEEKPSVQFCPVCGSTNPLENRYCLKCGMSLNVETYQEDQRLKAEATEEAMQLFAKLAQNPAALKRITELAEKLGGEAHGCK